MMNSVRHTGGTAVEAVLEVSHPLTPHQQSLVINHLPVADRCAVHHCRKAERWRDLDDVTQVARLALIEAADKWDPRRSIGVSFEVFARTTIQHRLTDLTRHDLGRTGRGHDSMELATSMLDEGDFSSRRALRPSPRSTLDRGFSDWDDADEDAQALTEINAALEDFLTEAESRIYREWLCDSGNGSGRRIAARLGLDESRVSQVSHKVLAYAANFHGDRGAVG